MGGQPIGIVFNGTRRIRVVCTGPLSATAFTSPAIYGVTPPSGASPPGIDAVFAISSNPNAVEIAIDTDVVPGGVYAVTFVGLPFADSSTFTGSVDGAVGATINALVANSEPETSDLDLRLFGRDIAHNGSVFLLDPSGDLGTFSGRDCYKADMGRRLGSDGLLWDVNYGAKPGQYVDAPQPLAQTLSSALVAQAQADDRTLTATPTIGQSSTDPSQWSFFVELTPIDKLDPVTVETPVPLSS